jgi:hypothetical protein
MKPITGRIWLSITLGVLLLVHAANVHASGDATACRRQVGSMTVACRADARGLQDSARATALHLCAQTKRARLEACRTRAAGQSANSRTSAALVLSADAASPTLTTDKFDYQPGDTITISGSGWQPGEMVSMVLSVSPDTHPDVELSSVADENGNFTNTDYTVQESDANVVFTLTATGQSSGATVQSAAFTDTAVGVAQLTSVAPTDGGCVLQDGGCPAGDKWDVEQGKTYTLTLSNVTDAANGGTDATLQVIVKSSDTGNVCLTATQQSPGVYTFDFTMPSNACNTYPILYGTSNCAENTGSFVSSIGCSQSTHLRAETFGANCSNPVADTDCSANPTATPTATVPSDTPTVTSTPADTPTNTPLPCLGSLTACKYEDDNANGSNDGEPMLSGWSLTISPDPGGGQNATQSTGTDGCVTWNNLSCASYTVTEAAPSSGNPWFNTDPGSSGPCLIAAAGCPSPSKTVDVEGPSMTAFGNIQSGKITVCKYEDLNANGSKDMGDPPLGGWTVDVTGASGASGTQSDQTDATSGCASFFVLPTLTYTAGEGLGLQTGLPTWFNTDPGSNGVACLPSSCPHPTKTGIAVSAGGSTEVDFGNVQAAEKHGEKFYDADDSGSITAGDGTVTGFKITLSGTAANGASVTTPQGNPGSVSLTTYTDASGNYSFGPLLPGSYKVTETSPNSTWHNTTPTSNNFTLNAGDVLCGNATESSNPSCTALDAGDDFGNVCVGAGNGLTLGWWSNKNGQAAITAADLCALNALHLKTATGTDFDPIAGCPTPNSTQLNNGKTALKNWLLSASATNMAYMLSAQLATMELNVMQPIGNSSVNGNALVFAGTAPANCTVPGLNGFGFISINNLMNDADNASNHSLASPGGNNTTASGDARNCQAFMKTTLDNANNNLNIVQSSPRACPFTSPY